MYLRKWDAYPVNGRQCVMSDAMAARVAVIFIRRGITAEMVPAAIFARGFGRKSVRKITDRMALPR